MIIPVILAGGVGARLSPLSSPARPKPFLRIIGAAGGTLFGTTLRRVADVECFAGPVIVGNSAHRSLIDGEIARASNAPRAVILEPVARNTAAAVAAAALFSDEAAGDAVLAVMPSDHAVKDETAFVKALLRAERLAERGNLVLLGIEPDAPITGYGYIERGRPLEGEGFSVAAFHEKPDHERARRFVSSGEHYWNSGIFVMSPRAYLAELARFEPAILAAARAAFENAGGDGNVIRLGAAPLAVCPDMPIDRAVMERTKRALMLPLEAGWSDVGSWAALWAALWRDDAVVNAQRHDWGHARIIPTGEKCRLRHVRVNPGAALPRQELQKRGHWVVVGGTAALFADGEERLLRENDGFTASPELIIENRRTAPLDLIDIETGG